MTWSPSSLDGKSSRRIYKTNTLWLAVLKTVLHSKRQCQVCVCVYTHCSLNKKHCRLSVCIYIIYTCEYVYIYMYINIYIYLFIYIFFDLDLPKIPLIPMFVLCSFPCGPRTAVGLRHCWKSRALWKAACCWSSSPMAKWVLGTESPNPMEVYSSIFISYEWDTTLEFAMRKLEGKLEKAYPLVRQHVAAWKIIFFSIGFRMIFHHRSHLGPMALPVRTSNGPWNPNWSPSIRRDVCSRKS